MYFLCAGRLGSQPHTWFSDTDCDLMIFPINLFSSSLICFFGTRTDFMNEPQDFCSHAPQFVVDFVYHRHIVWLDDWTKSLSPQSKSLFTYQSWAYNACVFYLRLHLTWRARVIPLSGFKSPLRSISLLKFCGILGLSKDGVTGGSFIPSLWFVSGNRTAWKHHLSLWSRLGYSNKSQRQNNWNKRIKGRWK